MQEPMCPHPRQALSLSVRCCNCCKVLEASAGLATLHGAPPTKKKHKNIFLKASDLDVRPYDVLLSILFWRG